MQIIEIPWNRDKIIFDRSIDRLFDIGGSTGLSLLLGRVFQDWGRGFPPEINYLKLSPSNGLFCIPLNIFVNLKKLTLHLAFLGY